MLAITATITTRGTYAISYSFYIHAITATITTRGTDAISYSFYISMLLPLLYIIILVLLLNFSGKMLDGCSDTEN